MPVDAGRARQYGSDVRLATGPRGLEFTPARIALSLIVVAAGSVALLSRREWLIASVPSVSTLLFGSYLVFVGPRLHKVWVILGVAMIGLSLFLLPHQLSLYPN